MELVRSWLGQALRATGAAVVVPLAILVALSLTSVGGGGLAGFGALSQLVGGPEAPGTAIGIDDGDDEIAEAVEELAAADPLGGANGSGGPGGASPGAGDPSGGGGTGGSGGGGRGPLGGVNEPKPPADGPGPKPPEDDGDDPPSPPPPPPPQRLVDAVGNAVKDVTSQTPAGPTVEEAIDGLLEACGQLNCP